MVPVLAPQAAVDGDADVLAADRTWSPRAVRRPGMTASIEANGTIEATAIGSDARAREGSEGGAEGGGGGADGGTGMVREPRLGAARARTLRPLRRAIADGR